MTVQRPHTAPQLFDLHLPAGSRLSPRLADGQRVMLYVYEGELAVNGHSIGKGRLARLSETGAIEMGSATGARVLLTGGSSIIPHMDTFFREKLKVDVDYLNPFVNVTVGGRADVAKVGEEFFGQRGIFFGVFATAAGSGGRVRPLLR